MGRPWRYVVILVLIVIGCAAPAPTATPGPPLGDVALKYRLVDELGPPAFCDPDSYPVGRDEVAAMRERFPEIEADREAFAAIATRLGLDPGAVADDGARLAIYRQWKLLNAIVLSGPDRSFDLLVRLDQATGNGTRVTGTITRDGRITITGEQDGQPQMCPICLAAGTRIGTPGGDVRVEDIRAGMAVWSVDGAGRRIEATVIRTGRTPVPSTHQVVRLRLADGRELLASPGHPLRDGRRIGDLRAGDAVDGSRVALAELEPYAGGFTFDLLTSGPTGAYVADGIVLRSTLAGDGRP